MRTGSIGRQRRPVQLTHHGALGAIWNPLLGLEDPNRNTPWRWSRHRRRYSFGLPAPLRVPRAGKNAHYAAANRTAAPYPPLHRPCRVCLLAFHHHHPQLLSCVSSILNRPRIPVPAWLSTPSFYLSSKLPSPSPFQGLLSRSLDFTLSFSSRFTTNVIHF